MLLRLLDLLGLFYLLGLLSGRLLLRGFVALLGLLDSLTLLSLVCLLCLASLICLACLNCLACLFNLTLDYLGLLDLRAHEDDCYKRAVSLLVGLTMRSYWLGLLCFARAYACSLCFGLRFFAGSDSLTSLWRFAWFARLGCHVTRHRNFDPLRDEVGWFACFAWLASVIWLAFFALIARFAFSNDAAYRPPIFVSLLNLLGLLSGWLVLRGFEALLGLLDSLILLCLVCQLCLTSLICFACLFNLTLD